MKENDIVWAEHNGQIKKCVIVQVFHNENEEDRYMVKVVGTDTLLMADSVNDLYKDAITCKTEFAKRYKSEYDSYCTEFGTLEELLSSLLYAAKTRRPLDGVELDAALHMASEFANVDMKKYFDKYVKDVEGDKTVKKLEKVS